MLKMNITLAEAIAAMKAKGVNKIDSANIRYHEFFDRQPYTAAGLSAAAFFTRPVANVPEEDCNLRNGKGGLGNSQCFVVCAVSTHLEPGADHTAYGAGGTAAAIDDYMKFTRTGRLVFNTGSRESYVENGPLGRFPPATQLVLGGVGSDSSTAAANQRTLIQSAYMDGGLYFITPKVIMPNTDFEFAAKWSTPVPITADGKVEGRLYGFLADLM